TDVLKLEQEADQEMIIGEYISELDDDWSRLTFVWEAMQRKYRRMS
ncbi:Replication protein, partial [Escherichia coli]|nr:Replication protein [Escherichia coli]